MEFNVFNRNYTYQGSIRAVILDWAGTAVDYGCFGPVAVFQEAFKQFGIEPTIEETRKPMGKEKKEHVKEMLEMPGIKELWSEKYGRAASDEDLDAIFAKVQELMPATLANYAKPVPGCVEALTALREKNIAIGSCTGYNRAMMRELIPRAETLGFKPDYIAASDDVPQGRPYPWMCWLNCIKMGIFPPEAVVKVGDTIADIQEGRNAGHWTVAVVHSSNSMGMKPEEIAALSTEELERLEAPLAKTFSDTGAHFVISDISELPRICDDINQLMLMGITP